MKKAVAVVMIFLASLTPVALATDFNHVSGHVIVVEADYMPTSIMFAMDVSASSSCPAGALLWYYPANADQAKAVYALLLSAKLSGTTIDVWGNNSGCSIVSIWAE